MANFQSNEFLPSHTATSSYIDQLRDSKLGAANQLPSTVSDDHSAGSSLKQRNLVALAEHGTSARGKGSKLSDYQQQLLLLEQQSKKRVMLARTEHLEEDELPRKQPRITGETTQSASSVEDDDWTMPDIQSSPASAVYKPDGSITKLTPDVLQSMNADQMRSYIMDIYGSSNGVQNVTTKASHPRYEIMYRITSLDPETSTNSNARTRKHIQTYLDAPQWLSLGDGKPRIASKVPIRNMELYMERNKDVSFIVYRDYESQPRAQDPMTGQFTFNNKTDQPPLHVAETIHPLHRDLCTAIRRILESHTMFSAWKAAFEDDRHIQAPYYFVYHGRSQWESLRGSLTSSENREIDLFQEYVYSHYGKEYADVDSCLQNGYLISPQAMYLFKPGELLVSCEENDYVGHIASRWPRYKGTHRVASSKFHRITTHESAGADNVSNTGTHVVNAIKDRLETFTEMIEVHEWEIQTWNWKFNGSFQRDHHTLIVRFPVTMYDAQKLHYTQTNGKISNMRSASPKGFVRRRIETLEVFPIAYAAPEIAAKLQQRGNTLWQCRNARIVSHREAKGGSEQTMAEERFMVDMQTFRDLHKDNIFNSNQIHDDLGPTAMAAPHPPGEQFVFLVQPKIKGYNLRLKKWYDLAIDNIKDVTWDPAAFESLVIDQKSKDLILALVTHQVVSKQSADVIQGKGNGLILLLHGGPGTGKTLTAESVAEVARKPLYRVTCGDVGTKAEDVEKYLESVFHLGKIWDCVVLLDEADVFLEQRSLNDLQRNALVSVFLRVLEYYEGILILTSNRVGTFDEAFKSRIQLALHYPTLQAYQRRRIWEMFIARLDSSEHAATHAVAMRIDTSDLRAHVDELQDQPMNGRQIRNAITTARQYAMFKNMTMNYEHLRDVIEVAGRFDKYIDELNWGYTLDDLAQGEGVRLA